MKPELRRLVEEHFGIPHPDAQKPEKNPQLDPRDPQQAVQLRQNQEYEALSESDKQEIQWQRRNVLPGIKKKAEKIIKNLKGEDCCPRLLSEKHDIFENYFQIALMAMGYERKVQIGAPSIGIAWVYCLPAPVLCPNCKHEIPKDLLKNK